MSTCHRDQRGGEQIEIYFRVKSVGRIDELDGARVRDKECGSRPKGRANRCRVYLY